MRLAHLLGPSLKEALREDPEQVYALLDELHPEDLSDIVSELDPEDAAALMQRLPAEAAAPIFERLTEFEQENLISLMPPESVAQIASEMEADDRADLFNMLDEAQGDDILRKLEQVDPEAAEEVREIEKWPETSAGHLTTTRFAQVGPKATVADGINALRQMLEENDDPLYFVYLIDDDEHLLTAVAVHSIAIHEDRSTPLADLSVGDLLSVPPSMDQEEVARQMAKYDLAEIPVLDSKGIMLGIITIDDVVDVLSQEQTEDVQKLGAVEPLDAPYFHTSTFEFVKKRGFWLVALFFGEFFTQTAMHHYDAVFEALRGAVYYIPLLISAGGNSGSQSSTLIIRGMAVGEIAPRDWWRVFGRELLLGLILGSILGAIGFLRVLLLDPDQGVGFAATIGVTLVGIVLTGCTVGALLPLAIKRLGLDPATSSTPFIASLVDVLGVIIFVYAAHVMLGTVLSAQPALGAP